MPAPFSVFVGEEVDAERISPDGVVFHGGTRIAGAGTLISAGVKLGSEAPLALENCRLGRGVELKGGFCKSSVFLERAGMASGAQVREGCLLEEEANGGHTAGLKHTILFPFVTLGSLINFCDCLMAGGTSRRDHSEVGSSYVHFNYTPNQDKATASLLGDVPRGVMLNRPPIFLGGQGGLVGPARIGFGTVIAAGAVWRGDCPEGGKLLGGEGREATGRSFYPGLYGNIRRRAANNIIYLANLLALRQWYIHARRPFFAGVEMGEELYRGALEVVDRAVAERLARFRGLAEKMDRSIELGERFLPKDISGPILAGQRELRECWPALEACIMDRREEGAGLAERDGFLTRLARAGEAQGKDYIRAIKSLDEETAAMGTRWLQQAVDAVAGGAFTLFPSCKM